MAKRAIVIVMDGCGAGAAPDAELFGDFESPSTIAHVWAHAGGKIDAPTLASLGLFRACGIADGAALDPRAGYGRMRELSMGKDSVTGHWEMMGIITPEPFPTYPEGFPIDLIKRFEAAIGSQTIGNRPASGTTILQELGPLHMESGCPIVYTSADSVFQIACHQDIVPLEKLYEMCRLAREMLVAPNNVQRVIARPFVGNAKDGFTRTEHRKDYPLEAPRNLVDRIGDVFGIGVVPELFGGRGFRPVRRTQNNEAHAEMLTEALASDARLIFANFEDFDMLYGHRNDPAGFARCLEAFDGTLRDALAKGQPDDLWIITADHGNDPTTPGTDHSREYVPLITVGGPKVGELGDLDGMDNVAKLVAAHLDLGE